jgi:hypothetical protein
LQRERRIIANMRRRTFLLAVGLTAYFIGASVRACLRCHGDALCGDCGDVSYRVVAVVEHPRAVFNHPLLAIEYLVAPVCND